ncbi:hypothetical protein DFH29DRAFT_955294 [Suillus ampliporus]|nr:hypothetical protein DFH29DRAFT_955294 [Suillus ampliporus]
MARNLRSRRGWSWCRLEMSVITMVLPRTMIVLVQGDDLPGQRGPKASTAEGFATYTILTAGAGHRAFLSTITCSLRSKHSCPYVQVGLTSCSV